MGIGQTNFAVKPRKSSGAERNSRRDSAMGGQSVPCMKARAEKEYHGRKTESKPVGPSQTFYSVVAHQLLMATIVSVSAAEAMSKKFDLPLPRTSWNPPQAAQARQLGVPKPRECYWRAVTCRNSCLLMCSGSGIGAASESGWLESAQLTISIKFSGAGAIFRF